MAKSLVFCVNMEVSKGISLQMRLALGAPGRRVGVGVGNGY